MKRVAIVQSNYIPWKGYFDLLASVDEFILYDDMQYTRRDWRNRNKIKTPAGLQWLTVPVQAKGRYLQAIRDTEIDGTEWARSHWKSIEQNYRRAPHFATVAQWLEPLYQGAQPATISQLNQRFIEAICAFLNIDTRVTHSWDYAPAAGKSERLADLCRQAGGTEYVSGPAARAYLDETPFRKHGIEVSWFDYAGYPEYPQLWGSFEHGVSIIDLLCNCGEAAGRQMRYVKP
ncbi:MAG: WbqC family protein [Burkholderiaceae bacterium]